MKNLSDAAENFNPNPSRTLVKVPDYPFDADAKSDIRDVWKHYSRSGLSSKEASCRVFDFLSPKLREVDLDAPDPDTPDDFIVTKASDIDIERQQWFWEKRLPLGSYSLLSGDPEAGKTTISIDIAARGTTGTRFPDGAPCPPCDVIYYTLEDTAAETVVPRFVAAGGDRDRFYVMSHKRDGVLSLDRDIPKLRRLIQRNGNVKLLILDPISGILGPKCNENSNADVRRVLGPLNRMAEECGICILGISHLGKASDERKGVYRTLGSMAFVAAARAAWVVTRKPKDPNTMLFLPQKCNLARVDGLSYRITNYGDVEVAEDISCIEWDAEPVTETLDSLQSAQQRGRNALDKAKEWLSDTLANPTAADDVLGAAKKAGISERTLYAAKKDLGVPSHGPFDGCHWWCPSGMLKEDCREYVSRLRLRSPLCNLRTLTTVPSETLSP